MSEGRVAYIDAKEDVLFRSRCVRLYNEAIQSTAFDGILPNDFRQAMAKLNEAWLAHDDALVSYADSLVATARTAPRAERKAGAGR